MRAWMCLLLAGCGSVGGGGVASLRLEPAETPPADVDAGVVGAEAGGPLLGDAGVREPVLFRARQHVVVWKGNLTATLDATVGVPVELEREGDCARMREDPVDVGRARVSAPKLAFDLGSIEMRGQKAIETGDSVAILSKFDTISTPVAGSVRLLAPEIIGSSYQFVWIKPGEPLVVKWEPSPWRIEVRLGDVLCTAWAGVDSLTIPAKFVSAGTFSVEFFDETSLDVPGKRVFWRVSGDRIEVPAKNS